MLLLDNKVFKLSSMHGADTKINSVKFIALQYGSRRSANLGSNPGVDERFFFFFSKPILTGPEAHPVAYSLCTELHFHLSPRLRISGGKPPPPLHALLAWSVTLLLEFSI